MERLKAHPISTIVSLLILILLSSYITIAGYYSNKYVYGTWINGIYCAGKTIEDINQELLDIYYVDNIPYQGISVIYQNGNEEISSDSIELTFDFKKSLEEILISQNPYNVINILVESGYNHIALPNVSYNIKLLEDAINNLNVIKDARRDYLLKQADDFSVRIELQKDNGYILVDNRIGLVDVDLATDAIISAINVLAISVDLVEVGCYYNKEYDMGMISTIELFNKINSFQNIEYKYTFGDETETINQYSMAGFIACDDSYKVILDDNGELIINELAVKEYVDYLGDKYDTYKNHKFVNRDGIEILIEGGNYGNLIDRNNEYKTLLEDILLRKSSIREPKYLREVGFKGLNDIGDTYIEINKTSQKLYYYIDGKEVLQSDIVTGNSRARMDTPSMVCYVYAKQKNRVLRGDNYEAFVNYWVPVLGAYGIHDATWRKEFGGNIYKTAGSHGCINLPISIMKELYPMLEVNTPVIIYDLPSS